MLTVDKMGGILMTRFHDVLKNIIIGNRTDFDLYNRIYVVSAYAGVTNWLLEHKKTGETGVYEMFVKHQDFNRGLQEVLNRLLEINKTFADINLNLDIAENYITNRIVQAKIT
jgi:aspartate kinase